MESWESKILRDKLNSLQSLPAGYSPDLSSKWEIIAAGLPERKKRTVTLILRWSVAAAIFICILVAGVQMAKPKTAQIALSTITVEPLPLLNLSIEKIKETTFVAAALSKKINPQKVISLLPAPTKELAVTNESFPIVSNETNTNRVDEKADSATIRTDELAATVPQTETPKKAKRRTYQKDFNDGLLVIDTGYSKPANPQFGFKFQLHPSSGDDVPPSRRLQLKQVL